MNEQMAQASRAMVQQRNGAEWVAIQYAVGMPNPAILPISPTDASLDEWQRTVECVCVVSRKPEHRHIPFPEPRPPLPLPDDWPTPVRATCVFWYHGVALAFSADELFVLSMKNDSAITEILHRLQALEQQVKEVDACDDLLSGWRTPRLRVCSSQMALS